MRRKTSVAMLSGILLTAWHLYAQKKPATFQGTWTATVGKSRTFRGRWTAAISSESPNAAQGFWTLLNDFHQVTLEGSWSARKIARRWHGTWTARAERGPALSGTWDAAVSDANLKTFADMLGATIGKDIAGFWQSERYGGNWWLSGEQPRTGNPE